MLPRRWPWSRRASWKAPYRSASPRLGSSSAWAKSATRSSASSGWPSGPRRPTPSAAASALFRARARLGLGEYAEALAELVPLSARQRRHRHRSPDVPRPRAVAGRQPRRRPAGDLARPSSARARSSLPRREALAYASLGFVLQRADRLDEARDTYRAALTACERAGDAGTLATVQTEPGRAAQGARRHRGRHRAVRSRGRHGPAQRSPLHGAPSAAQPGQHRPVSGPPVARAEQPRDAARTERAAAQGDAGAAAGQRGGLASAPRPARAGRRRLFAACAEAYAELGRKLDAAEARLEGGAGRDARARTRTPSELRQELERAEELLKGSPAHRPLLFLAQGRVASLLGDELGAREKLDASLEAARGAQQREWLWRSLEARAELEERGGQPLLARRDREEALAVLEEIGARLPRDLREVYWNDPRRKSLRSSVSGAVAHAATEFLPFAPLSALPASTHVDRAPQLRHHFVHVADRRAHAARAALVAHPRGEQRLGGRARRRAADGQDHRARGRAVARRARLRAAGAGRRLAHRARARAAAPATPRARSFLARSPRTWWPRASRWSRSTREATRGSSLTPRSTS